MKAYPPLLRSPAPVVVVPPVSAVAVGAARGGSRPVPASAAAAAVPVAVAAGAARGAPSRGAAVAPRSAAAGGRSGDGRVEGAGAGAASVSGRLGRGRGVRRGLALAALALVAGCAGPGGGGPFAGVGAVRVHSVMVETPYSPTEVRASGAPFPVEVRGAPPDGAGPEAVAAGLRLPVALGGAPLAAEAPGAAPRVVVAFGGAPLSAFCEAGAGGVALAPGAPMQAAVGLCRGDRLMTRGIVFAQDLRGPSDPEFAPAMNLAMRVVLPPVNPNVEPPRMFRLPGDD